MQRCVLIAGMPASGKTTFARSLGEELGIPVISKDRIKELMYDAIGFRNHAQKVTLGKASTGILYYYAESLMQANQPFILENNFENVSKPKLQQLLRQHEYHPVTVLFGGDASAIYKRFLERERSEKRHKGHVNNITYPASNEPGVLVGSMSMDEFVTGVESRGIRDFSVGGTEIYVDTTHFNLVKYADITKQIKDALGPLK